MLTVLEVAERINSTGDHVLDLIHSNRLRAVNIGLGSQRPRWRVSTEALEEFIELRTATAKPARRQKRREITATEFF